MTDLRGFLPDGADADISGDSHLIVSNELLLER